MHCKYLILGAGPTGLGAARRLAELGEESFLILERADHPGGLAASFRDKAGFTWDIGGHVAFSHFAYYDRLLDDLLGPDCLEHAREAAIRMAGTWVPYPFQNNIRRLPPALAWECVEGLLDAVQAAQERKDTGIATPAAHFGEWMERVFGRGIARHFMRPYNFKVWATRAEDMVHTWIGERVSVVDLRVVLRNLVLGRDDVAFGPNSKFRFPLYGGTGEIFSRMAARLGARVVYGDEAVAVDPVRRVVRTAGGGEFSYVKLLNTGPLDLLVRRLLVDPLPAAVEASHGLRASGVHVTGVGLDGVRDDAKCWMYFPEGDCPFYRVTNFHNYSPNNVAAPGAQRALMTETSFSDVKPEDPTGMAERTLNGLTAVGLMDRADAHRVVSTWEMRVDYGYPVPSQGRDGALEIIQPWLETLDIYSRGRFGGFRYEVSNMDHSVMQGVEWAERMVLNKPETVYTIRKS